MTYRGKSTPTFSFSLACISIWQRTPNPSVLSAPSIRATASSKDIFTVRTSPYPQLVEVLRFEGMGLLLVLYFCWAGFIGHVLTPKSAHAGQKRIRPDTNAITPTI